MTTLSLQVSRRCAGTASAPTEIHLNEFSWRLRGIVANADGVICMKLIEFCSMTSARYSPTKACGESAKHSVAPAASALDHSRIEASKLKDAS
jgi:hypothetical protein